MQINRRGLEDGGGEQKRNERARTHTFAPRAIERAHERESVIKKRARARASEKGGERERESEWERARARAREEGEEIEREKERDGGVGRETIINPTLRDIMEFGKVNELGPAPSTVTFAAKYVVAWCIFSDVSSTHRALC